MPYGSSGGVERFDLNLQRKRAQEQTVTPAAPTPAPQPQMPTPSMPLPMPTPEQPKPETPAVEGLKEAAAPMLGPESVADFISAPGSLRQEIGQRQRPSLAALQGLRY